MDIFRGTLLLILAVFVNVAELKEPLPFNEKAVLYTSHPLPVNRDVFYKLANGTPRNLRTFKGEVPCLVNFLGNPNVLAAVDEDTNVRQLYLGPIRKNKKIMLNVAESGDKMYVEMTKLVVDLFSILFDKPIIPYEERHPPGENGPGEPHKDNRKP